MQIASTLLRGGDSATHPGVHALSALQRDMSSDFQNEQAPAACLQPQQSNAPVLTCGIVAFEKATDQRRNTVAIQLVCWCACATKNMVICEAVGARNDLQDRALTELPVGMA